MVSPDALSEDNPWAEAGLMHSSSRWMSDALKAWAEDDYAKVAVMAPLALEHLGKAVLWRINPVLLVPLNPDNEASLLALASKPDLANANLRTIGLAVLLRRLEKLTGVMLPSKGRERLVSVRNGAIHVGTPNQSKYVLLDCLTLARGLLEQLGEAPESFYGENYSSVTVLLDEKRTRVGHVVAAKRARARIRLRELETRLGGETFQAVADVLEEQAEESLDSDDFGLELNGIDRRCPECASQGRLFGYVDAEGEPDWEVGDSNEAYLAGIMWKVTFHPQAFACNVCRLTLQGPEELGECDLPVSAQRIQLEELGEDFDPDVLGYAWTD